MHSASKQVDPPAIEGDRQETWQLEGNGPEAYARHLVPAIFEPWARLLVERAALRAGQRVLDVACGTGVVARLATVPVGRAGSVVGVDINPAMIAVARSLPAIDGAPIEWRDGDATALGFADASFDTVFCQAGLQYFTDRARAVREMARLLAPGGHLIVLVWRSLDRSPGFAALAAALERHVGGDAAAVMRAPFAFGDASDGLRALHAQAGLAEVSIRFEARMVRFPSPRAFVQRQVSASPLAGHVVQASTPARQALIDDVSAALQPWVDDEGVAFPIEAHIAVACRQDTRHEPREPRV